MAPKRLPDDFREFIQCLNAHEVRYLLVGGWAVGIHGNPRATKDIDFLVAVDDENVDRLLAALRRFRAPTVARTVFQKPGNVFRMGASPIQIDIINEASGVFFDDCFARRELIVVDGLPISTISKEDLIRNKRASGRHRDLADVEALEEH
jgi:predicted nucleotidyltransferase